MAPTTESVSLQASPSQEREIVQFVHDFLNTCGASYSYRDGVWQVGLPDWVADRLDLPQETAFTFDPNLTHGKAHLLAPGSAIVDAMVQLAKGRGRTSQLMHLGLRLHRLLDRLCASDPLTDPHFPCLGALDIRGAKLRPVTHRLLHQDELVFTFKVAYMWDEPQEEIHAIAVDPLAERVVPELPLDEAVSFDLTPFRMRQRGERHTATSPSLALEADAYTTRRLYDIACRHLEQLIEPRCRQMEKEALHALNADLVRIEEYYRSAVSELVDPLRHTLRRLAVQKARRHLYPNQGPMTNERLDQLTQSALSLEQAYREELDILETDRQRRLEELLDRHRIQARVELISAARILVPRIEWAVRLVGGGARRDITVCYDVLRERVWESLCDACDEPTNTLTFMDDRALLCEKCQA